MSLKLVKVKYLRKHNAGIRRFFAAQINTDTGEAIIGPYDISPFADVGVLKHEYGFTLSTSERIDLIKALDLPQDLRLVGEYTSDNANDIKSLIDAHADAAHYRKTIFDNPETLGNPERVAAMALEGQAYYELVTAIGIR